MFVPRRIVQAGLTGGGVAAAAAVRLASVCSTPGLASAGHLQKVQFPVNIYDYPVSPTEASPPQQDATAASAARYGVILCVCIYIHASASVFVV